MIKISFKVYFIALTQSFSHFSQILKKKCLRIKKLTKHFLLLYKGHFLFINILNVIFEQLLFKIIGYKINYNK